MPPVSPFFSWHNAPKDNAEKALYRIDQLENRFTQHVYETNIRHEFLLNILKTLVDNNKISKTDIEQAVHLLAENNKEHLRAEGDGSTMENDFITDIIHDIEDLDLFPQSS